MDEQPESKALEVASLVVQTDAAFAPVLFDAPELLEPPTFFADRAPPQAPEPVALRNSPSPEAEFRRVMCCILGFQRRPDFRTLWAAAYEDAEAFAARACIIVNPDPGSFRVVLVDPQPVCSLITFLLAPSWWDSAGLTPFAVSTLPDVPFFLQVAREQEDFDDWVPTSALQVSGSLTAQLIAGRAATQQGEDPFPNSGSLLVVTGRPGEDTGVLSAQQVLDGLPHVSAEEAVPVASEPQHNDVLLLGVAFDQKLVRLPIGAVDAEVASWAGLEEEPYHVHWQSPP